jgi:hypothetical protein
MDAKYRGPAFAQSYGAAGEEELKGKHTGKTHLRPEAAAWHVPVPLQEIVFGKTNPIFAKNNLVATGCKHKFCGDGASQKCRFSLHKTNPIFGERLRAEG